MKKTKIILLVTLGICMMSFIPAVLGQGKVNIRPISDFIDTNALPGLPPLAGWTYPKDTYDLTMVPHGYPPAETIADCNPKGYVIERVLKDGRISYEVDLHVKGATTQVYWVQGDLQLLVFEGEMDYYFSATLIVYEGNFGDDVPNLWMIWFPELFGMDPIGEGTRAHITANGTGTFTAAAEEVGLGISGDSVKVKINQVGMLKPDGQMLWPVEIIFFH
ncbi:MAG: hypothetical protein ACFFEN_11520 [Candidatus Thorarchaeota archaeon]